MSIELPQSSSSDESQQSIEPSQCSWRSMQLPSEQRNSAALHPLGDGGDVVSSTTCMHMQYAVRLAYRWHWQQDVLWERKPPPRPKSQPKAIRDTNPIRISGLIRIWMSAGLFPKCCEFTSPCGVSHFAKFHENRLATMRNAPDSD